MKCLSNPSSFFRRARPLGLPSPQSPALTPQHPKAVSLKVVNDIIRRSLSSAGKKCESGKAPSDGNSGSEESVADSFFDITRENEWFLLQVTERLPCARSNHAAVASGGNVYVVGGESVDGLLRDVQVFTIDRFSWKELYSGTSEAINSTPSENSGPLTRGPRLLAPFAGVWKGQLIVVGREASAPNDSPIRVHTFEPTHRTWTALKPSGDVPEARHGYRIVQVKSTLVFFGGEDANGRIVDDVFTLDLEKMTWTLLQTTGVKPAPRRYHAMACYGGQYIWVYGGKSYATYYNDIYCLDLKQLLWTKVNPRGAVPTMSRAGHVGIIRGDNFYIVGGENRGEEMVDTLAFDMRKRAWSVVTNVHAMSPLAHNGLSVLKVNHEGRQYLVAFGGHGILLSCQMYALLLPAVDQFSETNSLSSSDSLKATSVSKHSTVSREKNSPTDPFEFNHTASSLSSTGWESESCTFASAETGLDFSAEDSPMPPRKERPRSKTMSSYLNVDPSTLSGELYQPSRLSNASRHDQPPSPRAMGQSEKDFITIERHSKVGRSEPTKCGDKDGVWELKVADAKDHSRPHSDSPISDINKINAERSDSRTLAKKDRVDTDAFSKQPREKFLKAIKELQEVQRSNVAKEDGLSAALLSVKHLEQEIHELRRNKEVQERKFQNRLHTLKLMNRDKQGRRESTVPEIEHRNSVDRDNKAAANSCHNGSCQGMPHF